jgi:hypothetical protein
MILTFAAPPVILAVIAVPHLLPRGRLAPGSGIALWLAILMLRAALALSLAALLIIYLPGTPLFEHLTRWCFHAAVPFLATHVGLSGHRLGDATMLLPPTALALSLVSIAVGTWRGARAIARWLAGSALGAGPRRSVIVPGREVVVAAAGLRSPQVIVSSGALARLDDEELAAGLEHEWGHVARRHRFASLAGGLLFGVARVVPGSRLALDELQFHLERDADEYAVRRTGDRLALASAICKAAGSYAAPGLTPSLAQLGGVGVAERLRLLIRGGSRGAAPTLLARGLALAALVLVAAMIFSAPALAAIGLGPLGHGQLQSGLSCPK